MVLAIVVALVIGVYFGRAAGSMNVGEIGIGMAVAIISAVVGGIIGLFAGAAIASLFASAFVGALAFGGTRFAMKH
jgi:hypothetical protein